MSWRGEHDKYLKSKTWKNKRLAAFAHHGKKCACCDSTDKLEVHHISYMTYNRRGRGTELMRDLIPLCQLHHRLIHQLINELRDSRKFDPKYNWEKASKEALKYLLSSNYRKNINSGRKSTAGKLKKTYNETNKKIRKKKQNKQKELDRLNRGIGCAKGSQLRYISVAEEFLDDRKNS
jgi:excinuclease UvrABC ATPase subunit